VRPHGTAASRGARPLLTDREQQVLVAIARGLTNHEVAAELSIMPTTVKTYLRNTMRKLGARIAWRPFTWPGVRAC